MKNILKLFRRDCENVLHSVIGMIVVVGLVAVAVAAGSSPGFAAACGAGDKQ